jgi:hypothetical protein
MQIVYSNLPSYVYYTQVMQAETLASAYRLWRRNWRGPGREYTAGALVWQVREQGCELLLLNVSVDERLLASHILGNR